MKKIAYILGYGIIALYLAIISLVNFESILIFDIGNIYVGLFIIYTLVIIAGALVKKVFSKEGFSSLNKEFNYIFKFLFFTLIALIPGFLINHIFLLEHMGESNIYLRSYGKIAFLYLALSLSISPLVIFIRKAKYKLDIIFLRKIFGILSFIFFLKHGLEYFSLEYIYQTQYHMDIPYISYVLDNLLIRYDALSGVTVGIMMLILGFTSNLFSQKFLGKKWKMLQKMVFPAFVLSAIHIAFSSRFETFYILLIIAVVGLRGIVFYKKNTSIPKKNILIIAILLFVIMGALLILSSMNICSGVRSFSCN